MHGWDVTYTNNNDSDENGACFWHNYSSRSVTINLNKEQQDWIVNKNYIKEVAFHEVVESMLIGKLRYLAKERYVTDGMIDEACHEIINILKLTIFDKENSK